MTTPTDGVEGTQGKLFYWTRQGISLAEFQHEVDLAIARIREAGGLAGITDIGMGLITAATQQAARDVIDAASTAQAADGGGGTGGGGTPINLPIQITDVSGLPAELTNRSLVDHRHSASDINGLSTDVRSILAAADVAAINAILGAPDITALTARIAALEARFDGSGFLKVSAATPGTRLDVFCPGDVQPAAPTARTDVQVDYFKATIPAQGPGLADPRDGWVRWSG